MAIAVYNHATSIVPSDSTNIVYPVGRRHTDAIYVGGAGIVPVVFPNDTVVEFTAVAGEILPVAAKRVNNTNLTASLLKALYLT